MNIPYLVHLSLSAGAFQVYPISCYPNRHVGLINIVKAYDTSQNNLTNWSNTSSPGVDMKISKQYAVKKILSMLRLSSPCLEKTKGTSKAASPL